MPNPIRIGSGATYSGSLIKGNFNIGVRGGFGPSETTGFWQGISSTTEGFTIYQRSGSQFIIRVAGNDTEVVNMLSYLGSTATEATSAIRWASTQSDALVTNQDYPEIITDGLVLLLDSRYAPSYPLGGTVWYDLSGNGFHAGMTSNVAFERTLDSCFNYTGSSAHFIGYSSLTSVISGTVGISISSLIMVTNPAARNSVFDKYQTPATPAGYVLEVGTQAPVWYNSARFFAVGITGNSIDVRGASGSVPPNVKCLVTMTLDYPTKDASIWVNGATISLTQFGGPTTFASTWSTGTNRYVLGSLRPEEPTDASFKHFVQMVHNRPLTSTEVLANYEALSPLVTNVFNLNLGSLLSYPGVGTSLFDMSGYDNDGEMFNGPIYSSATRSLYFDGLSNQGITFPSTNTLSGLTCMTINMWIKPDSSSTWDHTLLYKSDNNNSAGWWMELSDNFRGITGANALGLMIVGSTNLAYGIDRNQVPIGNWCMLTATYDGVFPGPAATASAGVKIYINGVHNTNVVYYNGGAGSRTSDLPEPMTFGIFRTTGSPATNFKGQMGAIQVFEKQLSDSQVQQLYATSYQRYVNLLAGFTGTQVLLTTPGAGSWTKPAGVVDVMVECWGGGGAGGGFNFTGDSASAGGAGGQFARKLLVYPSASASISYNVAAARAGTTGPGATGNDTTWATNVVVAKGGQGGAEANITSLSANPGAGSTEGGIGDVVYKGGDGYYGNYAQFLGQWNVGSGGGGAGSLGPGKSSFDYPTNDAIPSTPEFGGTGASGGFYFSGDILPAFNGLNYGGGGGGVAGTADGPNRRGGTGAQGLIRITYVPAYVPAENIVLLSTPGSSSWIKPVGVTSVTVECWGGGGPGAGSTFSGAAGAGGAGGQYARKTISYSSGATSIPYVVAASRSASVGIGVTGNDTTWNTNIVVAKGGAPGLPATSVDFPVQGGSGSTAGGIGDVVYAGGTGGASRTFFISLETVGGGGGGGAGSSGPGYAPLGPGNFSGGSASPLFGGTGASAILSNNSTNQLGFPGDLYGAGGGGGVCNVAGVGTTGGTGAQGLIRLTYYL